MLASEGAPLVQPQAHSSALFRNTRMLLTDTRATFPMSGTRRRMYLFTTVLCMGGFGVAHAQSLVPELPSVELHLDALESLRRPAAYMPAPAPAAPYVPPAQPQPLAAAPAPRTAGLPSTAALSQPAAAPLQRTQALPSTKALSQPAPAVERKVPVGNPPAPVAPQAPAVAKPVLPPPPAPVTKAAPVAAKLPAATVKPVADTAKPLPTEDVTKPVAKVVEAAPVIAPLPVPAGVKEAAPAPTLDFSKLGTPQPAETSVVPAVAPKPMAGDVQPVLAPLPDTASALPAPQGASVAASDVLVAAKPVASAPAVLPPLLPPKEEDPTLKNLSDRMNKLFVKEPEKQGIVMDRTSVTGQPQVMPPAPDAAIANAAQAPAPAPVSNAAPAKIGSVLDKLEQGAKAAPGVPSVPEVAPAIAPKIAPAPVPLPPLVAAPVQEGSVEQNNLTKAKETPGSALATLPPLPETHKSIEKPKQMSLEEVNIKSPPASMATAPAAVKAPAKMEAVPVIVPKPEPVKATPAPLKPVELPSAAAPSTASKDVLKPGTLAALPAAPVLAPVKPVAVTPQVVVPKAGNVAPAASIADILPPPATAPAPVQPVAPAVAKPLPESSLPPLPSFGSSAPVDSSLPSLTALTGAGKSSMDIALDKEGVRSAELLPPATVSNTIPSVANATADLPKVTHGDTKAKAAALPATLPPVPVPTVTKPEIAKLPEPPVLKPEPVAAAKPVASAAVATPDKPQSTQLASTSVPATSGAPTPATVARAVTLPVEAGKPVLSVTFDKDKSDVELDMQSRIAGIADQAKKGESVRILAYASGSPEENSAARRISLSRALQVRAKLIEKGVDPMKITVQALGNSTPNAGDKADIIVK